MVPRRQVGNAVDMSPPNRCAAISIDLGPLTRTIPRKPPPAAVAMAAIVSSRSKVMANGPRYLFCRGRFEPGLPEPLGLAGFGNNLATTPPPPSLPPAPPAAPAVFVVGLGRSVRSARPHRLEVMK